MRAAVISILSLSLSLIVLGNAYYQKKQFYPSVVYITKSNPSMAVLYIQAFVLVLLFGKLLRKVFFGQLRAAELEHLIEKSWYAVTETCLAFTVFRDDFSPKFVALFTILLFFKCFHWLAEDRVDYMERSPVISVLFHGRVISLLLCLGLLDSYFVNHAYHSTLTKGASVQLVFGFEYAILLTIIVNIFVKYVLHTIDLQSENPWENKAVYLLYTELIMGFFKVILYGIFMAIMIKVHTFPLFAIRPMYLTMRSFKKAMNDVIMSRRAIRNMNTLYPDATSEELEAADNVCIICREEMITASKRLPCNHIFHTSCLRSWFQRQQTCPTCRMDVLQVAPQRPLSDPPPQPPPNQGQHLPFGLFPGPFPLWPPPPQPGFPPPSFPQSGTQPPPSFLQSGTQPRVQPTATPSNQDSTSVPSTSQSSTSQPELNQMPPPFPFYIPPLPFMAFGTPPPVPPPDLNLLSDDELRTIEGHDRQQVIARIQCLQNIQSLLDAAVAHMQQYTTIISSLSSTSSTFPASGSTVTTDINKMAKKSSEVKTESTEDGSVLEGAVGYSLPSETLLFEVDDIPGESDEQKEIRRRRLQRFEQNQKVNEQRHSVDLNKNL